MLESLQLDWSFLAIVLGGALATWMTRIGGPWLIARVRLGPAASAALEATPGAVLVALVVGFLAGGIVTWNAQRRHRRRARRANDRVGYLERELKETQARAAAAEKRLAEQSRPVSGPGLPAPVTTPATTAPTVH